MPVYIVLFFALLLQPGYAQLPGAKPVPHVQAIPLPYHQISFESGGRELARLHFSPDLERPFVFPVIGPSGRTLTRMGHPHDPHGHSHHNSIWISLSDVSGVDFWADRKGNRIIHQKVERIEDGDERASAATSGEWIAAGGRVLLRERRETAVRTLEGGEWMLLIDTLIESAGGEVTLAEAQFGPVGVRVAKSLGVRDGGGRLRDSEGREGEKSIFRQPARWVDYSGQVAPGVVEGLTLMDHPANPSHPAAFHVREDGWMGAVFTQNRPHLIRPGEPLRLRYGFYVHTGLPPRDALDAVWRRFAAMTGAGE
jgi:hypothetical protein